MLVPEPKVMSMFVVWIDREHAKLLQFSQEKMERKNLQAHHQEHHTHALDALDLQRQEREFFARIGVELENAGKTLILGPGLAKHHFLNYLMENVPAVAKTVAGCETVDHPTDAQLAAYAMKFFK